ncbi:phage transmembrane protein [Escherichia coli]|nr:phage transmembrane protein [Escherichia coli]
MVWDSKGDINLLIMPLVGVLALWGIFIISAVTNMTWLKILLAPKLYLIEYAASLVK